MKPIYALTAAFALALPLAAAAQWQWIDKDGRKVFSDQAPPADVPAKNILKRPPQAAAPAAAAEPSAGSGASGAPGVPATAAKPPSAPAPKVTGVDKDLEAKRKQAEAAEAANKKAAELSLAKTRSENCERARRAKASLESGVRIATTNAKGERDFMSDEARAAEARRINEVIAKDCQAG